MRNYQIFENCLLCYSALLFSVEETDISELEKRYWVLKAQSKTGRFDQETFKSFVCPPMPETLCEGKLKKS